MTKFDTQVKNLLNESDTDIETDDSKVYVGDTYTNAKHKISSHTISSYKGGSVRTFNASGNKRYYKNPINKKGEIQGKTISHRKDGPAVIVTNREGVRKQEWWVDGKQHRLDGPAIEYTHADQENEYWIDDDYYTKENWEKHPKVLMYKKLAGHPRQKNAIDILDI